MFACSRGSCKRASIRAIALEISSKAAALSREQVRLAFTATHNMYLTLNDQIAQAGPCMRPYLPAWRRQRNAWAAFYSKGYSPWRYDEMSDYRFAILKWRGMLIEKCGIAERELLLMAAR